MKIVGVALIISLIAPSMSFASNFDCKGNVFTRLDNGRMVSEQIKIMEKPLFSEKMTAVSRDGKIFFETKRKSDEWIYYSDRSDREMLFVRGVRSSNEFTYSDMRFNRESFIKFRDNATVGFNIVCRMK